MLQLRLAALKLQLKCLYLRFAVLFLASESARPATITYKKQSLSRQMGGEWETKDSDKQGCLLQKHHQD